MRGLLSGFLLFIFFSSHVFQLVFNLISIYSLPILLLFLKLGLQVSAVQRGVSICFGCSFPQCVSPLS